MDHLKIHTTAVSAADNHHKTQIELLDALEQVWRNKTFVQMGCHSLFEYSTKKLNLSEELASIFNKLAKKFTEIPEFKNQIASGEISISKGNRISGILTKQNAEEWFGKAKGTKRNLEKEIAKAHPEKALPERARYKSVGETMRVQITYSLTEEKHEALKRAQDLMSQKLKRSATIENLMVELVDQFLEKNDPLKKSCPPEILDNPNLTVTLKRKVHHIHNSQCTHINDKGERCPQRRHLDIHHIIPKAEGGTNEIQNLTLLCSGHHRVHHQAAVLH